VSHTPGPWTHNQSSGTVSAIEGPTRKVICRYVDGDNARLIAAAPEMLEALKAAIPDCRCTLRERESGHLVECFAIAAKEAIAKATGGAQ
jgi:hypothetical protein